MASQPTRPWFRLSSLARATGPVPTPTPAPARPPTPAPAPLVRPTLRPLAPPPPAEPTPPPSPSRAPTLPPAPASTPTPPQPAAPTPTPPPPAAAVAPSPAAIAPAPQPPLAVTGTTASVPSSPARSVYSAPTAASPPATSIAIASSTSSSVPPSPGNKVTPSSTSGVPSPRNRVTTSPPPQTSPPKPTANANLVPPQTYSPPKPRSTTISSASSAQEPSPNYNPSPRTTKPANNTPPQSPNRLKPTAPPPSLLNLPPSQLRSSNADQTDQRNPLDAEQKTVLVQKTIDQKPNSWFSTGGSKQDHDVHHAKHEEKMNRKKLPSHSEVAAGIRVITLAGENKGAYMELIRSPNKHQEQSHFLYKRGSNGKSPQTVGTDQSDKSSSSSSGDEGKPKLKEKSHRRGLKAGNSSQFPLSSFTNSNVQGINNSILYNSCCTHHDPGVHLSLARKPNGDGFNVKSYVNSRHI